MENSDNLGVMYRKEKIDDDFSAGKNKRNKKNKNNTQTVQEKNDEKNMLPSKQQPNSSNKLQELCSKFPSLDKEIISELYHENGYDFDSTLEALKILTQTENLPSSDEKSSVPEDKDLNDSPKENCCDQENYDILEEHDDLYDQISCILGSALDRTVLEESELDDLLNMCEENVCFLIEEEQKARDISQQEDTLEVDEITKDIQEFILSNIQQEQKNTIINTSLSNFPSLSSTNKSPTPANNSSGYGKILENEQKKVTKKIQPTVSNNWSLKSSNNQIHVGIKPGSTKEIIRLCKHFPSLSLNLIKTVYTHLDEDFEHSVKFLLMKYKDVYQKTPAKPKKVVKRTIRISSNNGQPVQQKVDETVEQILRDYTFQEMRERVQQLTRIKFILDRTAAQARNTQKYSEVSKIESAARDQACQLDKFSKASKKHILEKARRNKEFYQIDLHGLYWEEARELVIEQINYISNNVVGQSGQFKYIEKIRDGRRYLEYCIITGKGNNSRNAVPVLFNNLSSFLKDKHIMHDAQKGDGKVIVYLPIS